MSTVTGSDGKTYTLGSTEYTNYLLGGNYFDTQTGAQIKTYTPPPTTAPTTTTDVKTESAFKTPDNVPYPSSNISTATASLSGTEAAIAESERIAAERKEEELRRIEAQAKQNSTLLSSLKNSLTSPTEARQDAQEETGIIPSEYFADQKARIAEIGTLTEEYNKVKASMEQQMAASYDKMASNSFIDNQRAQIKRNAEPELSMLSANINAKSAVMQALQGNFAQAQSFVNQAVQDAIAENKYQFDLFSAGYEMNQDIFDRMDSVYKTSYESAMDIARLKYEQALSEKSAIGQMMIDPALRGAGINITDTYEEALAKAQAVAGPNYLATQNLIHGDKGGTTNSTTGLTKELQEDFQLEMAFIAGIGEGAPQTREEASEFLRKSYTALASKYGDANFELLRKELDRLYPPASASTTQSSGGFLSGFKGLFSSPKPISTSTTSPTSLLPSMTGYKPLSLQPVEQSFFGNLFSQ